MVILTCSKCGNTFPLDDRKRYNRHVSHCGKHLSEETKKKVSMANLGRVFSPVTRAKLSKALTGKSKSEEARKNMSLAHTGVPLSEEHVKHLAESIRIAFSSDTSRKKRSEAHKGQIPWIKGRHHTEESKKKSSNTNKKLMQDPEFARKRILAFHIKPNKQEKLLNSILQELYPNEFALNVNGEIMTIGGKIPDFVNINGQKKLIELFGEYWHKPEEEFTRPEVFKPYGWDTLIVWSREIKNLEILKQKITTFVRGS